MRPPVPCFFVALLVAFCPSLPVCAQGMPGGFEDREELPDSPAGKRMAELLETVNTGNLPGLKAFIEKAFAPSYMETSSVEELVDFLQGIHQSHSRLRFVACRNLENNPVPGSVVAIVHTERSDRWMGVMIAVEPEAPHRITFMVFNSARPPEGAVAGGTLTPAQLSTELRGYLESLESREAFSGSVLVALGEEVVLAEAFGDAEREPARPNTVETRFGLSSMSKMFTAVAIAQLVDAGRLGLDDPVSRHLGEDWLPSGAERLTIRHLLSHTGGTGDFLHAVAGGGDGSTYLEVSDYRKLIAGKPLAFEPGTRFQYSNSGFILLGAVIEKLTGQRYEEYLRRTVWGPAGMDSTAFLDREGPTEGRAIGYYREAEDGRTRWKSNAKLVPRKGSPAGGCYSTVDDLFRFARALRAGKLVRPGTLAEMITRQSPPAAPVRYGLGFILSGSDSDRVVGHGGSFPGAYGELDIYLDRDATVVVLSNGEGAGSARDKARELIGRLPAAGS